MIKVITENLIDRMEDKIDTYLKPIISDTHYDLEYDYSKRGFLMYIYKGISPKTILDKMLSSKRMSRIFNMNMDRSNPRTIVIRFKR